MSVPNRAEEESQKRECIQKLLDVWLANPTMRLGQLLDNAVFQSKGAPIFYIEDITLVQAVIDFSQFLNNLKKDTTP